MNSSTDRTAVFLKTGAVATTYAVVLWTIYSYTKSHWPSLSWLALAAGFVGLQAALTITILLSVYIRRSVAKIRQQRELSAIYFLRQCFAAQASGEDLRSELEPLLKTQPSQFDTTLLEFIDGCRGPERDRLRELAFVMGTVGRSIKAYESRNIARRRESIEALAKLPTPEGRQTLERAMHDQDESLRLTASRSLLIEGGRFEAEKVFAFSLRQAPVFRALVAEDLRPFILELTEKAVPQALRKGNADEVLAALDIIWSWGRVINVPEAIKCIDSPDSVTRAVAIQACRYAAPHALAPRVRSSLEDPAPIVRRAAAEAAERLVLADTLPQLQSCLADSDERVARSAAKAISRMGEKGLGLLEAQVVSGSARVAAVSLEALEKARLGRIEWE